MRHRRDLERHRNKLEELREITESMRALAYLESRKVSAFIAAQEAVLNHLSLGIGSVMAVLAEEQPGRGLGEALEKPAAILIAIGSERGFCGDMNDRLLQALDANGAGAIITVGAKFNTLVRGRQRVRIQIDGAGVADEVNAVLVELTAAASSLLISGEAGQVDFLAFRDEHAVNPERRRLLAPVLTLPTDAGQHSAYPPLLNLSPLALLTQLLDQYLFASLHEVLYTALLVENSRRVTHLQSADQYLERKVAGLRQQANIVRQEEITEEIEVLLLNVGLDVPAFPRE